MTGASLADRAFRMIEAQIVTLVLPPGSATTEQRLCQALGLGRTPVREALLRLTQGFLVEIRPRQGVRIRPIEPRLILQTLEIRRTVERLVIGRAATLADAAEREALAALVPAFEESLGRGDPGAFAVADASLNELLSRAARHEVAARMVEPLHCVSRRAGYVHTCRNASGMARTGPAHIAMAEAVAAGDAGRAVALLDDLLDLSAEIAGRLEETTAGSLSTPQPEAIA